MNILIVTNMWPIQEYPYFGIFVKEQVESIKKTHPDIKFNINFIKAYKSKFNYIFSIFQINFHLLRHKYDIIHIHFGLSGLFLLFNPFIKTPIVTTFHGSDLKKTKLSLFISTLVAKRSNYIFYLNKEMKKLLNISSKKMRLLPCGVNSSIFKPNRITNNSSQITIIFPASKDRKEKNYPFFLNVINLLKERDNFDIVIIELHNKSRIEVRDILNMADVLVMTSFYEGSPQIIKEALSCNIPIVSSNVGDISFTLQNVKNCAVIDTLNEELFYSAIKNILLLKPDERNSNGQYRIEELQLSDDNISKEIVKTYSSLL